jgi:adenylate cyclase, class 2
MNYEVEQKFRVMDLRAIESSLTALGVAIGPARTEADLYYAHPARDFSQTDEALRIRRRGDQAWITYKGPKIDALTKTRHELDIALGQTPAADWAELWLALGFRPVAEVRKSRRKALLDWQGWRVEVSLDDVEQVGTFVELEVIADESQLDAARACLAQLAAELGLNDVERRSYLELLLAK